MKQKHIFWHFLENILGYDKFPYDAKLSQNDKLSSLMSLEVERVFQG